METELKTENNFLKLVESQPPRLVYQYHFSGAEDTVKRILDYYNVSHEFIKTPCRQPDVVEAKRKAMYILCKYFDCKLIEISGMFGVDHCTVIYHRERLEQLIFVYAKEKRELNKLIEFLQLEKPVAELPGE
ncbi:MAG TPA: helix-turn-helix domain-containing protein [Mucilaginibacter sp.]|jgi:chromosomal replication initiation ATPase DnaA